ncbi:hypothetical protein AAIH22_33645, partial [Pseudomonas aeruginosa]
KIDGKTVYSPSQAQAEAPQAEDAPAPEAEVAADTAASADDRNGIKPARCLSAMFSLMKR